MKGGSETELPPIPKAGNIQDAEHLGWFSTSHCHSMILQLLLPVHFSTMSGLLHLQLGEKVDEPLEALLVPVDPEEVHLLQAEHGVLQLVRPLVLTPKRMRIYYSTTERILDRHTATKIPFIYSFSGNCAASVLICTFMCL